MRRGFTIIELLVASLLLGLLVTILTMVFNQSSIAWRTGIAGTVDMDKVRENIAETREEADNAFVWGNRLYRHTGLWKEDGRFRQRACDAPEADDSDDHIAGLLGGASRSGDGNRIEALTTLEPKGFKCFNVGSGNAKSTKTYTVNVMSAGPDRVFDTWDDIWSWPDDFE